MGRVFGFQNFFSSALSYVSNAFLDDFKYDASGIYIIKNKITGECYVGQSISLKRRLREHKRLLREGKEKYRNGEQTLLQKAWNKYGEENFQFDYIEHCDKNVLDEREIYWIQLLQCNRQEHGKGYNISHGGTGVGKKENNTPISLKGTFIVNNGDVQKYINPKELSYYESLGYKRGLAPKNIEKLKNTDRKIRKGVDHPNSNKTWSETARERFNNTIKNRAAKPSDKRKSVIQYDLNNNFIARYESITEASEKTGISQSCIIACCKHRAHTAGGFRWEYENE